MTRVEIERRYLWFQVTKHLWFMGAVWLFFYRFFMSDYQVGVLDAISFGIGLLAEIPSGALADHFGRKRLVIAGVILAGVGMSMQGLANSYIVILIGQVIVTVGWAFRSGADDALFYDALDYDDESSKWRKLVAKGIELGLAATLTSYVIGGYLYTVSPRLPFVAAILTTVGALIVWQIPEKKRLHQHNDNHLKAYLHNLKSGVGQLGQRQLIGYLPVILIVQSLFYAFGYGLLRPILQARFEFDASASGWLLFLSGTVTFILQRILLRNIEKLSEKWSIAAIGLATAGALFLGAFSIGKLGFVVIFVIYASEYLIEPFINDGLNKHINTRHRATALSAAAFLKALPYVLVAPLIGALNVNSELHYYLLAVSSLSVVAIVLYLRLVREKPLDPVIPQSSWYDAR